MMNDDLFALFIYLISKAICHFRGGNEYILLLNSFEVNKIEIMLISKRISEGYMKYHFLWKTMSECNRSRKCVDMTVLQYPLDLLWWCRYVYKVTRSDKIYRHVSVSGWSMVPADWFFKPLAILFWRRVSLWCYVRHGANLVN